MSFRRYQKSDKERLRKHHPQISDTEDWRSAGSTLPLTPNAVMQLQRTIGNQAVQRLISRDRQGGGVLQRDSGGNKEQTKKNSVLASITFAKAGKLKGNTKIAGHEGKIDVLSIQSDPLPVDGALRPTPPFIEYVMTRNVDELSPQFLKANLDGDSIKAAQFEVLRHDDKGKVEVVHSLEFSEGLITNYLISSGGSPDMIESIGMEFKSSSS